MPDSVQRLLYVSQLEDAVVRASLLRRRRIEYWGSRCAVTVGVIAVALLVMFRTQAASHSSEAPHLPSVVSSASQAADSSQCEAPTQALVYGDADTDPVVNLKLSPELGSHP